MPRPGRFSVSNSSPAIHRVGRATSKSSGFISQANDIINLAKQARTWYTDHARWTVSVTQGDRLYDMAHRWFTDDFSDRKPPRALSARYGSRRRYYDDDNFGSGPQIRSEAKPVDLFYDERGDRDVEIDGHRITVSLKKPDADPDPTGNYRQPTPDTIYFHARSREGQVAVVRHLESLAVDQDKRKPALHLLNSWGDWSRRDDLPERTLASVALRQGQMEKIRADVQNFLDAEGEYIRRGMPYHRGYLLHGPPGTGKTSIVRALAAHFQLDLWYAPLGDLDKDTKLLGLINQVRPGSILLLEDIDVFHAASSRDDEKDKLSMAGLLNALDGVATPHGLITFMTTNDIHVLDDAVIRAGRVDLREEIGLPDLYQISQLFNYWYNENLSKSDIAKIKWTGSTAELTELFKRNLNDPEAAFKRLCKGKR